MKVFNITKNNNTFVKNTRMPLNSVYGKFRLCNGTDMVYYIDDFAPKYGALWFHVWNDKRQVWEDTNTRSNRAYVGFHCYINEKLLKFGLRGSVCVEYIDNSVLPGRKVAQNDDTMIYKVPHVGYALNNRIMTDDVISCKKRRCVQYTDVRTMR